jgi:competence protein ComEC
MPPTTPFLTHGGNVGSPKLIVDFIDVGQGNCVLVTYPDGKSMLVDCGSQEKSLSGDAYVNASKYIKTVTQGRMIDCVVLSHCDEDHTVFVPHIPEAKKPQWLHFGGKRNGYSAPVEDYIKLVEKTGTVLRYRLAGYSDVNPDADLGTPTYPGHAHAMTLSASYGGSPNSQSIVLMVRFGLHKVVLPGDAELTTEGFILGNVPAALLKASTVLMPGHHGSAESTGEAWAGALSPQIDAISASGENLGYAHPACSTNTRLLKTALGGALDHKIVCSLGKAQPYNPSVIKQALLLTGTNGDIRFVSDGTNWRLLASSVGALGLPEAPPPSLLDALVSNPPWARVRAPALLAARERELV